MGSSGFKEKRQVKINRGPKLEFQLSNDKGDTMVSIDNTFITYIQWDQIDEFCQQLEKVFTGYSTV